jgi:GWxTD domain-containing protein
MMSLARFLLLLCLLVPSPQKREESGGYYRKWLEQDVVYIITEEERAVFLSLTTDEERDNFIQQFWARRDRDSSTPDNEFREEHYRRTQYANDQYAAGIPGWKTDRGRVYIVFGKPDEIESYPAGGSYQRKPHEGGGWTSVYPFEVWRYRYIEGVGEDIELEFVNDAGGNLYRLTMDPQAKDEFLHVPGMGFTDSELSKGEKSFDRVHRIREDGLARNQGIEFERVKDSPLEKSELLMKISTPPPIRFTDLKEKVTTRILYSTLPFKASYDFIRLTSQNYMVPITLSFDPAEISYRILEGMRHSRLQVYGLVTSIANRRVFEFDDEVVIDYAENRPKAEHTYQRKLPLPPGRFKIELLVKDTVSNHLGSAVFGIDIPAGDPQRLSTSSIMLGRGLEASTQNPALPYVFGPYKLAPQVDRTFKRSDDLVFYVEAYNFQRDQMSQKPALEIKYGFAEPGALPGSYRPITHGVTLDDDRVSVVRIVQLNAVSPGKHDLVLSITDLLSGHTSITRTPFEVR